LANPPLARIDPPILRGAQPLSPALAPPGADHPALFQRAQEVARSRDRPNSVIAWAIPSAVTFSGLTLTTISSIKPDLLEVASCVRGTSDPASTLPRDPRCRAARAIGPASELVRARAGRRRMQRRGRLLGLRSPSPWTAVVRSFRLAREGAPSCPTAVRCVPVAHPPRTAWQRGVPRVADLGPTSTPRSPNAGRKPIVFTDATQTAVCS